MHTFIHIKQCTLKCYYTTRKVIIRCEPSILYFPASRPMSQIIVQKNTQSVTYYNSRRKLTRNIAKVEMKTRKQTPKLEYSTLPLGLRWIRHAGRHCISSHYSSVRPWKLGHILILYMNSDSKGDNLKSVHFSTLQSLTDSSQDHRDSFSPILLAVPSIMDRPTKLIFIRHCFNHITSSTKSFQYLPPR